MQKTSHEVFVVVLLGHQLAVSSLLVRAHLGNMRLRLDSWIPGQPLEAAQRIQEDLLSSGSPSLIFPLIEEQLLALFPT